MLSDEGYSALDEERWAPEPPKSESRTAFERDRARLIHSLALRRLGVKSQILIAGIGDFARTRPTHTLEVAQTGRQIGALPGYDPDVVDCICLAHDLGHPPFGHSGECALVDIASNTGGFEDNAQTTRILTRLESKIFHPDRCSAGVNLTCMALDAAVKYPWILVEADRHPKRERPKKFCVYPDDEPVFRWLKVSVLQVAKPMECQIMDLLDDIAHSVHDAEDPIATGAFDPIVLANPKMLDHITEQTRAWYGAKWDADKLLAAFMRLRQEHSFPAHSNGSRESLAQLRNITSDLIGRFCWPVEVATRDTHGLGPLTRYPSNIVTPENTNCEIVALKGTAVHFVMAPRECRPFHQEEFKIVSNLVDVLMADPSLPSDASESQFLAGWNGSTNDNERLRVAIDQVVNLAGNSTLVLHSVLC